MQETKEMRLGSQGLEDPLEEEWQPTQVFLPGKSRVQRSLAGYNPWGGKESDTPKWMSTHAYTHIHTIGSKTEMHLIHCRSLIKIKYGNTYSLLKKNCFYVDLLLCSCSVMSNSLPSHELQHASLPCPSLSPGVCSNSCHFLSHSLSPSFPASGSFPVSQLFASCGQSIGVSASVSVLPMNIQGLFPLGLMSLITLWDTLFLGMTVINT